MQPLSFPREYEFETRTVEGKDVIFDALRRKYVPLTPEEWVRQNFIQFLLQDGGFPRGRTAVETGFTYQGILHRADVLVYGAQGQPLLMAECKAPGTRIARNALDQIARYNLAIKARYLVVTNGLNHHCWVVDPDRGTHRSLDNLPRYDEL